MKKKLKTFTGILLLIFIILIATPYFFKDKIVTIIKEIINENVNATVDFNDVDLSLISNFPNVKVSLKNFVITTFKPFEGDTLASAKSVSLKMPLTSLFKASSGNIAVNYFSIEESNIHVLINKQGQANYNIAKETSANETTSEIDSALNLSLDGYNISNSYIYYLDEASGMYLKLEDFNHKGSGNFSTAISEFTTETSTNVSLDYDNTKFINHQSIQLKAIIGVDLNENKFTFLENEVLINQLKLVFDGFVKLNETNQEIDLNFKTPSADFKNFFALIPEKYSKDISGVKTTGQFTVEGFAKGIIDNTHIPQFDIQIVSTNASFKYPDLPKTIQNIDINTAISNNTGITNDTKVNVKNFSFKIDDQPFSSSAFISNIISNPNIVAKAKGAINLNAISQAYPMQEIKSLQGIIKADFKTDFDMKSIKKKQYHKTKNAGNISLANFKYEGNEMANPIEIKNAQVTFNTKNIELNNFDAKTGKSDLKMNGNIENLIGFVLNNENIKGDFNLTSTHFNVNDFMVTGTEKATEESSPKEQLKIPPFLDCTINAVATTVIYDNLTLRNAIGTLAIKDEQVTISNL
ncbi:MAG: AsmA family protein, partial [Bacteroidetes bacterium]|nr:AsmA family protein [Bacteroidota bacterium]